MATYNSTNGIISARVIQISKGKDQVRLALIGTGSVGFMGMKTGDADGWHAWDAAQLPAEKAVLEIPCKSASVTSIPTKTVDEATGEVTTGLFSKLSFEFAD